MNKNFFYKTFEKQMMSSGLLPNMISGFIVMPYIFCYSGVKFNNFLISLFYGLAVMLFLQLLVAPRTNHLITSSVSKKLDAWNTDNNCFTREERTILVKEIANIPLLIAIQVFSVFFIGCIIWIILLCSFSIFTIQNMIYAFMATIFGSILSGLFTLDMAEKVCSSYAKPLVNQGIDPTDKDEVFGYGLSIRTLFNLYIIIPLVFSLLLLFFLVWSSFFTKVNLFLRIDTSNTLNASFRILFVFATNLFLGIFLAILFFRRILSYSRDVRKALQVINNQGSTSTKLLDCDYSNELSYNVYLINQTISLFRTIFDNTNQISHLILNSTDDLLSSARNVETISIEQSTSVKEIVATMEDSDKLSQGISQRINEVAMVANKTALDVQEGVETLSVNLEKMNEITNANVETISGIKLLSEKIENIWEIVTIINGIADQTKVIALNAELEAVSAGESGKNFHIVANEIRRLADGTMESIKEIREKITEIQHSSDNLIIASEGGTEKILEGCELSTKLKKNFANIKSSAEVTAESSKDISLIIAQQTSAFEQILITLRQISASIESSSESNQTITKTCEDLQKIVDRLNSIG